MDDFSIWSEAGMEYEFEKKINKELEEVKELLAPLFDKYFNDLLKVNLKVCDSDDSLREREPEVIAKIKKVYELTKGQ